MASKEAEALIQKYGGGWAVDRANAEQIRQEAKAAGTWGVQQNSTLAYTPPKVVVPEEKKTAADKTWDRKSEPEKISETTRAKITKNRAEKALSDFDEKEETDWTDASERQKYENERKQLEKAVEQAGAELAAREAAAHQQRDTADIAALNEEDRDSLEQYAVNQVRDQNLPIELTGMMPTARQEASDFIDKFGQKRADELAETFMREENAKLAEDAEAAGQKFAEERPVIGSAATVPINLMSGIVGTVGQLQGAARATGRYGSLDANETGTALDKFSGAVRDQVAQDISGDVYDQNGKKVEEGGALRQIGSLAYQGGMSFLDSTARMLASGGVSGVSSAIAALGGFSQSLQKYSAMGASPEKAALAATAAAGLEYITEKLPTDEVLKIFHKGGSASAVKEVLKQTFVTEPLGEEINLFAGIAAEALILGEKSGKAQRIGDLIAGGMTKAEAEKQFWKETFAEAAETYAVSAVAGGLGAGSASIAGRQVQQGQEQQQTLQEETDAQVQQEALPTIPEEPDLAQLAMEDTAAGLQGNVPAAEPAAPMNDQQQNLQMAMEDLIGGQDPQEQTTKAVTNPIESYPPEKQNMIRSYIQAVDTKIKDFVQRVKSGDKTFRREKIGDVSDRAAKDIGQILGVDVAGYTHNINTNGVQHIINRHGGKEGGHDNTLELADDVARIGWVLENYDRVEPLIEDGEQIYSGEFGNNQTGPAPQIRFVKKIDGYYYVVEAAFENKHHKLWVQSARLQKNNGDVTQAPAEGPSANHETNARSALTSPSPTDIVSENIPEVNDNSSERQVPRVESSDRNVNASASSPQTEDSEMMPTDGGQPQIKGTGAAEGNFSSKPAYNATLSEDNAQADRRNDVRPMELPQTDVNGNRISATTGNVYAAGVTPDEFASLMEEPTARGDFSYVPISNNEATQAAMENISRYGWEDAYNQWSNAVHQGRAGAEMSARGALFLNHAAQAGNRQQWLNILSDFQRLGTNTAQGLQAFRILRNLAPSDRLYMIRRSVNQMVEDMHLNVPIQIDQQMADRYQNARTQEEADEILDVIMDDVARQIPSTIGDRWTALRYLNMLGNLRTQVRNVSGNIGAKVTYLAKDQIGAVLEKAVQAVNPNFQRTKSNWVNQELKDLGRADFDEVRDIVLENGRFDDARRFDSTYFRREVNDRRQIFDSRILEGYRRLTNWAMNNDYFGDAGFARAAYARAFGGYLKANGFTGNTLEGIDPQMLDEARLYAIRQAQESTFRDHNAVSGWISRIGRRPDTPRAVRALSEGVMPFRTTPANVLVRAEEFSPLGLINTAVTAVQARRNGTEVTGTDVVESLAKSLTGTGLCILGAYLGRMGILSGGSDPDEEKAEFDKLNGQQNYALQLPDGKNVTIDFLSPLAVPMFLGAELEKIISGGGKDLADYEAVFTSLADPLIQMSMLQGLNDSLDNIKYSDNNLGQFFLNACMSYLTQGLTNTLMGQIERSTEENRQTTFVDKDSQMPQWMQQQLGKASQKIPGWDFQQMEYQNAWGQPDENEGGLAYNLLSPGYISTERSDAVSKELYRLREETGENVFPQMADKTITYTDNTGQVHKDHNLSREQLTKAAQTEGQTARRIIEDLMGEDDYQALPDVQKAEVIRDVYSYAREKGQMAAIEDHNGHSAAWMTALQEGSEAKAMLQRRMAAAVSDAVSSLNTAWNEGWKTEGAEQMMEKSYDAYKAMTPEGKRKVLEGAQADARNYIKARDGGISHQVYVNTVQTIQKIRPEAGHKNPNQNQKMEVIAKQPGMTEKQRVLVAKLYGTDAQDKNIDEVKAMGYDFRMYTELYRDHEDYTKGDGKKKRTIAHWQQKYGFDYKTAKSLYEVFS